MNGGSLKFAALLAAGVAAAGCDKGVTDPTADCGQLPISRLHSAVLLGTADGKPFRSETTLLPNTKMIMPANPKVGDVFRPENICGLIFEEVTVKSIGATVTGPSGPVSGAIVTSELHLDGSREEKVFAPGYGEFSTGSGANLEAIAVAVPTDALTSSPPAELHTLLTSATSIFNVAGATTGKMRRQP